MRKSIPLLLLVAAAPVAATFGDPPGRVMSINLCADQLLMSVAQRSQIASLSWLASDPDDSAMAREAAAFPKNYGSAEELIRLDPDLVVAGLFTAPFTVRLARRLGYPVVELPPANSVVQIETNLRTLGEALQQQHQAETVIADMRRRLDRLAAERTGPPVPAVLIRTGSFTVGEDSLANELMTRAGFHNIAAQSGLDRWGSLSLEGLLTSGVDVLILSSYRDQAPSLANNALAHPALQTLLKRLRTRTVPGNLLACGGPQSVRAAEQMVLPGTMGRL